MRKKTLLLTLLLSAIVFMSATSIPLVREAGAISKDNQRTICLAVTVSMCGITCNSTCAGICLPICVGVCGAVADRVCTPLPDSPTQPGTPDPGNNPGDGGSSGGTGDGGSSGGGDVGGGGGDCTLPGDFGGLGSLYHGPSIHFVMDNPNPC